MGPTGAEAGVWVTSPWGIEVSRREGGLRAAWAVLSLASVTVYALASTPSLGEPEPEITKFASMEEEGEVALHALHVLSLILIVLCCAQSRLTLGDPMDCSPTGSSVHGIFQARMLAWVAISFPRDLPNPGIKPMSLVSSTLAGRFFTTSPLGKPLILTCIS